MSVKIIDNCLEKLSRMETVYNEEEKKLILKKFQKSTRDLLKDKKNELGELKIKKLQDLQEKYKIEGKNELLEKVTQEIELLKKEQEYLSQNEVEEEIQEKKPKRSAVLKDEDTSDETAEKNENISEEKLEKNIKSLEKILQKDIINEEDLKIILDEDEEMKLEFDILQEMCDDLDKDDPIRKMENLNYSKEPSYKNIVERKKEFDIRFESYFQRKDGENVSFDFQEKEFWTEIDTLGDKIEEETLKKAQPQGYVKLLRQKQILEECIKTAKDPDFQEFAETYVFSEDHYRIDCGLMIQRPPIFVKYIVYLTSVNDEDMKFLKTRRDFFKKYHYDFDKISPEIDNFNDYNIDYWDNVKNDVRSNNDNDTNLRKWNKETNKYDFYSPNSKNWKLVDPNMKDNKSIQYNGINRVYMLFKNKHTGKWEFPTLPLRWGENFNQRRQMLQYVISRDLFKVHFPTDEPSLQITRDMFPHEEKENNFVNFNGNKVYLS